MRNLVEYPPTVEEVTCCIEQIMDEISSDVVSEMRCGDMRPVLLQTALVLIKESGRSGDISIIRTE